MAIPFNDNIRVQANKPLELRFGPFASITEVNTVIPIEQRVHGLLFGIYTNPGDIANSDIEYYYYWDDLSDTSYKRLLLEQNFLDAINMAQNASSTSPFVTVEQLNSSTGNVNRVLFGGVPQWSGTGLIFDAPYTGYIVDGVYYEDGPEQITLAAADPTDPRRDRFILSSSGWGVLQGTPAAIPVAEEINIITQIDRGDVLIEAGATTPTVTNENVYIDNAEWATSFEGVGTFNPNSTSDPFSGTKSFEATNIQAGATMIFTNDSDIDLSAFTSIGLQIKLKASMNNGRAVTIQFLNNSNFAVSSRLILPIVKSNSSGYQFASLPLSDFNFTSISTVRKIWISYFGTGGPATYAGYFIDNVILQSGVSAPGAPQNIVLTNEVTGSGVTGSAIPVTITEKAISNKPENTTPSDSDMLLLRRNSDGAIMKISRLNLLKRSVAGVYVDTAAMQADQANQQENNIYQAGTAFYKYKGTTTGVLLTDYDPVYGGSNNIGDGVWKYSTTITAGDPGAGRIRFNNTVIASATEIYIDILSTDSIDFTNLLSGLKEGDIIYAQNKNDAANWIRLTLSGDSVDNTGYFTLPISFVDGAGSAPGNNHDILVRFGLQGGASGPSLPAGGTTGQILAKNSNDDGDAGWINPPTLAYTLVSFSTVILMTGNFKSVHTQTAAIAYTRTLNTPTTNFENKTIHYISSNGTGGKPTFSADFILQKDTWLNTAGSLNRLTFITSPSGKVLVWMENIE